jgi:purine nucleoside phosphorylase
MKIIITDQSGMLTVIHDVQEITETRDGDFIVHTGFTNTHGEQPFHHPNSDVRKIEIAPSYVLKGRRRAS